MRPEAGFQEKEHTADWELKIWAPDLPGLLQQAAQGMYTLSGTRLKPGRRDARDFSLQAGDPESLLVRFLSELLFLGESDGLGFDRFELVLSEGVLSVHVEGAPILSQDKEIKAVTYHNLVVRKTEAGLEANVVFDV